MISRESRVSSDSPSRGISLCSSRGIMVMQGQSLVKIAGTSILLAALLTCLLSGNASASTSSVADNLSNRTLLSQPRDPSFNFLLAQQAVDSTKLQTSPSLKRKSPYMAAFYSVIPGRVAGGPVCLPDRVYPNQN